MNHIVRTIEQELLTRLNDLNKIIVIYGARQTGKTTLIKRILEKYPGRHLLVNADEKKYIDILSSRDFSKMESLIYGYDLLFIDEAQRVENIGINLKILHDGAPNLKIVATGSSPFDLANKTKEPLTGRAWSYQLYPISLLELSTFKNKFEIFDSIEQLLVYGFYPEVFHYKNNRDKQRYLMELTSSYLYKDVIEMSMIKHVNKIHNLLKLLSFQVGSLVSINELSRQLEISKEAVTNYIDLLEKSFVIFRLQGFNRNLRKEISKMDKIYFWDLGVRNAVISNFNDLSNRNDIGQLWENFLIVERKKSLTYKNVAHKSYFWRTYTGGELDYVEELDGKLFGFEFKWGDKKVRPPITWIEAYTNSSFELINKDNYIDFILNSLARN